MRINWCFFFRDKNEKLTEENHNLKDEVDELEPKICCLNEENTNLKQENSEKNNKIEDLEHENYNLKDQVKVSNFKCF